MIELTKPLETCFLCKKEDNLGFMKVEKNYVVVCNSCHVGGVRAPTPEEAADNWNNRDWIDK